jgi:site-specific recombinase XerD/transposase InsO family protein
MEKTMEIQNKKTKDTTPKKLLPIANHKDNRQQPPTAQTSTKDKVLSRYNAHSNDEIWTIDFTNVKTKKTSYWITTVMDLATRQIIAHSVKKGKGCPFTAEDVVNIIHEATLTRQKPKAIHTDQGGQFIAEEFSNYLKSADIRQSIGDQVYKKFPNQVHESSNKTIKGLIRQEIRKEAQTVQVPKNFNHFDLISETQAMWIINNAISAYNEQPHTSLFKASPNLAEVVLAQAEKDGVFKKNESNEPTELVIYATDSPKQIEVKHKLAKIFRKHALEWIKEKNITEQRVQEIIAQFYKDVNFVMIGLQLETLRRQEETLQRQEEAKEQAVKDLAETKAQAEHNQEELRKRIGELQTQLEEQTAKLEALVSAQRRKDEEKKAKAERKLLRSNRKRLPARDAATTPELLTAWNVVEQTKAEQFTKARDKTALLLLYISGERIANLRLLTANHLQQILDHSTMYITLPRIKSKETKYRTITMSKHVRAYINKCEEDIKIVLEGKRGDDYVMTAKGDTQPMGRAYFNSHINQILKKTGSILHKKLSSHSFRIGLTTSIIETSGIHAAQAFIGHANISTTNVYSRATFGLEKMREVANKADTFREQRIKKTYKKNKLTPSKEGHLVLKASSTSPESNRASGIFKKQTANL